MMPTEISIAEAALRYADREIARLQARIATLEAERAAVAAALARATGR